MCKLNTHRHITQGLQPIADSPSETTTRGLDNLAANARIYHSQGARFAKWRAALRIGDGLPSDAAVRTAGTCAQHVDEHASKRLARLDCWTGTCLASVL